MIRCRFALVLVLAVLPVPLALSQTLAQTINDDLRFTGNLAQVSNGAVLHAAELLSSFYTIHNDAPGWVTNTGPLPAVDRLLSAIRNSRNDGLSPADYHLHEIDSLLAALHKHNFWRTRRVRQLAALELLASDAFLLLSAHESRGRVDPARLGTPIALPPPRENLVALLQSVFSGADPLEVIHRLEPEDARYDALRRMLARYYALAANGGLPQVTSGTRIDRNVRGPTLAALIARLEAEHDLQPEGAPDAVFTPAVEAAVKRFQARHGLNADGIVGRATLAALNEPLPVGIDRLRVNLERRRWLPRTLPDTRMEVNIADFHGTLYVRNQAVMDARMIVGTTVRQTPEFESDIRTLVINPAWNVPPSIAGEELLPKIQADPGYLAAHGIEDLQGRGAAEQQVDPATVNWKRWTAGTLPYFFRQLPGPENPLGRVKFQFANRFDVYLHDTPSRALFDALIGTFSHGCIRTDRAVELAVALLALDGRPDPAEFVAQAVASGETRRIDLPRTVPIYIQYLTAFVNDTGVLEFRKDIYQRDAAILRELDAPLPERLHCCTGSALP